MSSLRVFMPVIVLGFLCGARCALAQADIPADQKNLPPVAAPVTKVEVNAIPVVRSESQEARDFTSGLIAGLTQAYRVKGLAVAAVQGDHVTFALGTGGATPDSAFGLGNLANVFTAVVAMQEVEKAKLLLTEDASKALGEQAPRNVTPEQLLTGAVRDQTLLQELVAKSAGLDFRRSVEATVLMPLGMTATGYDATGLHSTANDMTHLMIALVNGGTYADGTILQPETVALMERTHRSLAPALPGWTYGFAEMRRGGWFALQHDGKTRGPNGAETRLVIVPEAKLAYFIAMPGHAPAAFWRALDDALFDKLAPPRANANIAAPGAPPPTAADARRVGGVYAPAGPPNARMAVLKLGTDRLRVRSGAGGTLLITGARTGVLRPRPGGIWSTENGAILATISGGRLVFGDDAYRPLAAWKSPALYAWLALIAALAAVGAAFYEWRSRRAHSYPSDLMLGTASVSALLLLGSVLVYLLAPAAV